MFHNRPGKDSRQENDFFGEIYETYRNEMFYVAYGILQNKHDAEDVVHETFMALFANIDRMEQNSPKKNRNYILTIVKNKAYNLYKTKRRQAEKELGEDALEDVFDEEQEVKLMEMEKTEFLKQILKKMNPSYRDILLLQYYHGLGVAEVAEELGKSPDNVRHMSMRAKKRLKEMLEAYGFADAYLARDDRGGL